MRVHPRFVFQHVGVQEGPKDKIREDLSPQQLKNNALQHLVNYFAHRAHIMECMEYAVWPIL